TGGGWEGEATYFDPGMGSCGITSGPSDMIAAISYQVMDPKNPGNPNNNPLCGKKIRCTRGGKYPTIITVVDRCPVCKSGDLDLSPAAYAALGGTVDEGRFTIQCNWV
ncbi:RlpA-like double-psi beta-barrel-protein domain-containing protein-containing protein, partial [Terfezia claveryi]